MVANDFEIRWNAPHVLGAIDGKHVGIKKPPDSGSLYFNYKKQFSIVLMAVVNANYEFIMVDVGTNGRVSDGGVLQNTEFGKMLKNNSLNVPSPEVVTNTTRTLPYVFVGDDAFPMGPNLLKPYSQSGLTKEKRIFNYRLARARRLVESAFGILATRFGVFQRQFSLHPVKVRKIVLACCYLHNFLRKSPSYLSQNLVPHEDTEFGIVQTPIQTIVPMTALQTINQRNSLQIAKKTRNDFCEYFNNEGAVPWQNKFVEL